MSGGMPGGGEGLVIWGVSGGAEGVRRQETGVFQKGRLSVSKGCPGHPPGEMEIDIVTRENKILAHGLNEKSPTIM